ncbi:MAG: type IV pilus modification protein PilV [Gammaproteobacteria bacterium]|nr:type IV pilus modification protein PilV [Gammaproteobacteria bacterium]MBU1655303.1 type IV pilus modification protein PilV [Gammaproteobacteria bacterium]MBU1960773.1 type IV pilus modification protein PilV [Gammaproteobacteria bacterium]
MKNAANRGMSLIEVMVAVFVLSVGLLGVASLQGVAKKANHQAYQRTLATHLVDGIIERIRANPRGAGSYETGKTSYLGGKATKPTEPSPTCAASSCTPAQLAAHDLWEWERAIDGAAITHTDGGDEGGLISPRACIVFLQKEVSKSNTGLISVRLSWRGLADTTDAIVPDDDFKDECGPENLTDDEKKRRRLAIVNTWVYDVTE